MSVHSIQPKVLMFFFLIFCLQRSDALAQSNDKKATKRYSQATELYGQGMRVEALVKLDEATRFDEEYFDAFMLKGQIFAEMKEWKKGADALNRAFEIEPSEREDWQESLVSMYHRGGMYKEAYHALEVGEQLRGWQMQSDLLESSVRFANTAIDAPSEFHPTALLGDVNSELSEYYPALYSSGDRMVFTRELVYPNRSFGQEDFYEARKEGDEWWTVRSIGEVNTPRNEGAPSIRGDGRLLVFTACAGIDGSYGTRTGVGSCDLFQSDYNVLSSSYNDAANLEELNSAKWESQPALSADGQFLFFVRAFRSTDTGEVVQDIYVSERSDEGSWLPAVALPGVINSKGREENPFLHSDGVSLYFASDGLPGMGGMDLFVSRKQDDGTWSEPENLGYPINTHGDENSLQVFADGSHAIFATDRNEPGNLDLWEFELPVEVSAKAVALWTGEVRDNSGDPIEAKVQVLDLSGRLLSTQNSDPIDGQFTLSVKTGEDVVIQIEHPDFAFYSTILSPDSELDPFVSISLQKLEVGITMTLRDVRFEKSSAELDGSFQPELEQLAKTMLQSKIRIEILGHTDSDGTAEVNLALSELRAEAVAQFLESRGVERGRMELRGLGETEPIASNETDEGKAENRRTEIVIIN